MLAEDGFFYVLGGATAASLLFLFVHNKTVVARNDEPVKKAIVSAWGANVATAIFLVVLLFSLPSTPALSTFGFPKSVERITRPEDLLEYLQRYNRAIVRTTEVVSWSLFVLVFWFLASQRQLLKAFRDATTKAP